MAGVNHGVVWVLVKDLLLDVMEEPLKFAFAGGFPKAAGEKAIADEDVRHALELCHQRRATWGVSAQNVDL